MKRSLIAGFAPTFRRSISSAAVSSLPRIGDPISREQRRHFRFQWSDTETKLAAVFEDTSSSAGSNRNGTYAGANETDVAKDNSVPARASSSTPGNETETKPTIDMTSFLAVDPNDVEIVTEETVVEPAPPEDLSSMELFRRLPFVSMFRGSANYIANHRNTLAVYHIPGDVMDLPDPSVFRDLMNDVALTWLLGMKIVIVVGCRYQVDKRLSDRVIKMGMSVTDSNVLRVVKEEAGYVRFEVERQLARSLRMQSGTEGEKAARKGGYFDGNVVSGNFYSAQPFGILDGVDFKYTGFVRRVEVDKIRQVQESRDIVLLTPMGVSPSGEVFNVHSESLAATVAGALDASKIIFFTETDVYLRNKVHENKIHHLRVNDAHNLLNRFDLSVHKRGFTSWGENAPDDQSSRNMLLKVAWSMHAAELGVKRAHIISPTHGALLQELYTRDGSGTMISRDIYDGIRRATIEDVNQIYDLISPLVKMGTLIPRPRDVLEQTIESYYVYTRDDLVLACGQLKLFDGGYAELGCLVVNPAYRSRGRGDAMLGYLERLCLQKGASVVFVLSTQTMEWFVERGFEEVGVDKLPPTRPYNYERASKIYMRKIASSRDLDASELWWNR